MISPIKRVIRLAHKELREILRDRRTIVTLIAMPLLLYPLMAIAFQQFYLASRLTPDAGMEYRIAFLSNAEYVLFDRRLKQGQGALLDKANEHDAKKSQKNAVSFPKLALVGENIEPRTVAERLASLEKLKESLHLGSIDVIITVATPKGERVGPKELQRGGWFECEAYASPNSGAAQTALNHIDACFAAINESDLKARLNRQDIEPRVQLLSMRRSYLDAAKPETVLKLAALVPLILILMTITGAVYPAIDLTAGERERGTLEILVAAPVSRFELLTAKYISVLTVAILTALVNLACMVVTLSWSGVGAALLGNEGLSFEMIANLLGLLLLFAAFFSAVLLCLTSFARSFKEAQAYLIPLMMASLAPGVLAMVPDLELTPTLASLPLVNVVLMARDLFDGKVDLLLSTIVILTTVLYALAALALAARIFGAESVLYSEQSNWADLLRRPPDPQPTASIPAMLWCLALTIPLHFAASGLLRVLGPSFAEGVPGVIFVVALSFLLFAGLPMLFSYLGRVDLLTGAGMRLRDPVTLGIGLSAGLILGWTLWPIQLWLLSQSEWNRVLQERLGHVLENVQQARERMGWAILATVIVPAMVEEFFFRGLLFNALRRRAGALVTIGTTAALFAMTHVVLGGALGMERLMPSLLLGLILSTVGWYSGSVWPSMVLHVCHNTILMIVGMGALGQNDEVPWEWRIVGIVGTIVGFGLLSVLMIRKPVSTQA